MYNQVFKKVYSLQFFRLNFVCMFNSSMCGKCFLPPAMIMKLLTMKFSQSLISSSLLGSNICLSILFANTLRTFSSLSMRDEMSNP